MSGKPYSRSAPARCSTRWRPASSRISAALRCNSTTAPIPTRVINLDRTQERLALFLQQNPGLDFTRFAAIDGAAAPREDWIAAGLIASDNAYGAGARGCAASHVALWRECAHGDAPLHVLEDDVVLRRDFPALAAHLLLGLGDWDIVCWSWNFDWPLRYGPAPGLSPATLHLDPRAIGAGLAAFRDTAVPVMLAPMGSGAAMGCYSLSPKGAASLLRRCLPIGSAKALILSGLVTQEWDNTGVDVEVSRHYAELLAYVCIPPLAIPINDQINSTVQIIKRR